MNEPTPRPEPQDPMSWDWSRAIFDRVHLRVADLERSRAFYATVLEPLGIPLHLDTGTIVGFANLALSADASPSTGAHLAFTAADRGQVDAFHAAGIAAGFADNGPPGERDYGAAGGRLLRRVPARSGRQQRRGGGARVPGLIPPPPARTMEAGSKGRPGA